MAGYELTQAQRDAISSRGGSLIVSAAAGAGKTFVLVRRILGLVSEDSGININNLMVVTFTNAASAEMRARIADTLNEMLVDNPDSRHLRRQLMLLGDSRIQTVHSFCQWLLKRYFERAGISPDFAVVDETDCLPLRKRVMDEVMKRAYEENTSEFSALCDNICEDRGDRRLVAAITDVFDKLSSCPHPQQWLAEEMTRQPRYPEQADWGKTILDAAMQKCLYARKIIETAIKDMGYHPEVEEKYFPAFNECLEYSFTLEAAIQQGWDAAYSCVRAFENPRLTAVRGADPAVTDPLKAAKESFKAIIIKLRDRYFTATAQICYDQDAAMRPLVSELCRLVTAFAEGYTELKRSKNILDYSDLEHMALGLLEDENGERSDVAKEISAELAEILVDEYQDTNDVQERIFTLLKPEKGSLFFVGDVKQSIYRFRLAKPEIFIRRYLRSGDLTAEEKRLSLSANFRSRPEILEACNHVFEKTMTAAFGDIDYDEDQRLYPARPAGGMCEICMVRTANGDEEETRTEAEARYVAHRVRDFLDNGTIADDEGNSRRPRPGDIAVLLSSFRNKSPYFVQAMRRLGVPVDVPEDSGFFTAPEVLTIISFLNIIDNPRQDIALISVMRSPLYLFTGEELAQMRLMHREADIYDCLCAYAEAGHKKAEAFLEQLRGFWEAAQDMSVSDLLLQIYSKTGARGIFAALENGGARLRNLDALYSAAVMQDSSYGISGFLRYLEAKREQNQPPVSSESVSDAVQIMSVHKSKGLEFPIVFLPDLAKEFNKDDLRKNVMFHASLGIGMPLRDKKARTETRTNMQRAIGIIEERALASEELRKLYVAMTRARERLIMVMSDKSPEKKLPQWLAAAEEEKLHPEFLAECSSAMPWVYASVLSHPGGKALRDMEGESLENGLAAVFINAEDIARDIVEPTEEKHAPIDSEDYTALLTLGEKQYAHTEASELPSKLTPSGVRRITGDEGEIYPMPTGAGVSHFRSFPFQKREELSATQRGTALHVFISMANLCDCTVPGGVKAQLEKAVESGILTAPEAESISVDMITRMMTSPTGQRILAAEPCLREYQFGALFTPRELIDNGMNDEYILLNGAIDMLLFDEDGNMEIVDFKSDSVQRGEEEAQAKKHELQLRLYAMAAEKIFQHRVVRKTVFFLKTGCGVAV